MSDVRRSRPAFAGSPPHRASLAGSPRRSAALAATLLGVALPLTTLSAPPSAAGAESAPRDVSAGRADGRVEVRFATFNASLNRSSEGELVADLSTSGDAQAAAVAEIVQRVRPDVLLVNEFDFDASERALELFQDNYLSVGHNGA